MPICVLLSHDVSFHSTTSARVLVMRILAQYSMNAVYRSGSDSTEHEKWSENRLHILFCLSLRISASAAKWIFEPSHEIVALFVLRKLILQTHMRSHPVALHV